MLSTLVKAIPLGLDREQDQMYDQEKREDLLESAILVFHKVNEKLHCTNFSPSVHEE